MGTDTLAKEICAQSLGQLGCSHQRTSGCSCLGSCLGAYSNALEDAPDEDLRYVESARQYDSCHHEKNARVCHDPGAPMIPAYQWTVCDWQQQSQALAVMEISKTLAHRLR